FLPAAAPRASDVSVGAPEERGISLGWLDASYDFDPDRYHESIPVRVRGVSAYAVLVDPFTGSERVLPSTQVGDAVDVRVPFDRGPAALLMFPPFVAAAPDQTAALTEEVDLGSHWVSELVPTMDNTWGDFARPAGAPVVLERWAMRHRTGDGAWLPAHATFGPHATGLSYSTSRGIRKDPIHRETL